MKDLSILPNGETDSSTHSQYTFSKDEQRVLYNKYKDKELKLDDKWYLIDFEWFKKWLSFIGINTDTKHVDSNKLFEINNKSLLNYDQMTKKYSLKQDLLEEVNYKTIPEELWNYLVKIYSLSSLDDLIERKVINDSTDEYSTNLKIEIRKLRVNLTCNLGDGKKVVTEEISRQELLENLIEHMKKLFHVPNEREVRLFYKNQTQLTPIEIKRNITLNNTGCGMDDTIMMDVQDETGSWLNDKVSKTSALKATGSALTNSISTSSSFTTRQSARSNQEITYSYSNRHNGCQPGLCGLSNLGNTCFMNSAIQCMSNVPPLTDYFRQGLYKKEINLTNPLGCKGELAEAYADLVNDIWSGNNSYTIPRNFKLNLSRFAPQFTGFQQQDSQELLAFLLDGLHEDLNRIQKKPYIELGSHVGKTDEQFAEESWQDHKKRNDSIIVDIFHGLLKSTLNCLECSEISIKFDPFCYLSVPLPSKKERLIELVFVPLDQNKRLVKYKVSVLKNATMQDLCASLENMLEKDGVSLAKNHMVVCDVYTNKFFKIYEPTDLLTAIKDRDDIYVYELPTNYSNNDYYKIKLHIRSKEKYNSSCFGLPLFIMVPKGNQTYGSMYQHVLKLFKRFLKLDSSNLQQQQHQSSSEEINLKLNNSLNVNDEEPTNDENSNQQEMIDNKSENNDDDDEDVVTDSSQTNIRASNRLKAKAAQKSKLFQLVLSKSDNFEYDSSNSSNSQITDETAFEVSFENKTLHQRDYSFSSYNSSSQSSQIVSLVADFTDKRIYNTSPYEELVEHSSCSTQLIKKKDVINLSDCFTLYTKIEELSEQDYWYCSKCKTHQRSTKKFDLWKLPKVLVVHLKRFSYSKYSRDKIDSVVDFPLTDLDMSNYLINKNAGETRYNLIAVSNHYGSLGGGHYTANAQNRYDRRWYNFDDSSVSSTDESSVCTNAAYLLVYLRKDLHEELLNTQQGQEKMEL